MVIWEEEILSEGRKKKPSFPISTWPFDGCCDTEGIIIGSEYQSVYRLTYLPLIGILSVRDIQFYGCFNRPGETERSFFILNGRGSEFIYHIMCIMWYFLCIFLFMSTNQQIILDLIQDRQLGFAADQGVDPGRVDVGMTEQRDGRCLFPSCSSSRQRNA